MQEELGEASGLRAFSDYRQYMKRKEVSSTVKSKLCLQGCKTDFVTNKYTLKRENKQNK